MCKIFPYICTMNILLFSQVTTCSIIITRKNKPNYCKPLSNRLQSHRDAISPLNLSTCQHS